MSRRKLTHAVWPILSMLLASLALAGVVGVLLDEVGMRGENYPTWTWIGGGIVASVVAALLLDAMFKRRLRRLNDALIEAAAHEGDSSALMRSSVELRLLYGHLDVQTLHLPFLASKDVEAVHVGDERVAHTLAGDELRLRGVTRIEEGQALRVELAA